MQNSTITSIVIIGIAGIAGYFFYESYIKKAVPSGINTSNIGGIFQSANQTVSNFLNSISNTGSNLLNQSGSLNKTGINNFNSIMSNPLQFNDLMSQVDLNSALNNPPNISSSTGSSTNLLPPVMLPYVTPGATADLLIGA